MKKIYHKGFTQHHFLKKESAGFTLIELIIVISLLAVLSIVGIAAFASYSRAQTLNGAAGDLSVMFNLAKSRAYSQVKINNSSCTANTPLEGYEVRICGGAPICISSGVSYELNLKCGGYTPVSSATYSNLTFTSTSAPAVYSFLFPVLKGGVVMQGVPAGQSGIITISNNFSETRTVIVDPSGNIRVSK